MNIVKNVINVTKRRKLEFFNNKVDTGFVALCGLCADKLGYHSNEVMEE